MIGLGTIANVCAILAGSFLGLILRRGFPLKWQETILQGIALCVLIIGVQMATQSNNILIVIASIVAGTVLGEMLDIDDKLNKFGAWVEGKIIKNKDGSVSGAIGEGFIAASLIYCVGAMAIVGSIQDGLTGDPQTLYAKSMLDGISAIIFTANMGIGVALSAISVGIYQGILTLLASYIEPYITKAILNEISAVGGILIMGIGLNMLKVVTIRIANQLPSIIIVFILARFLI